MKVITAKNCGFCFGVKNAVDIAAANAGDGTVIFGKIIHNDYVLDKLSRAGAKTVDTLEEALQSKRVIIRSHGVGKDVYDALNERGIEIIDATCPFVKNIHEIVRKRYCDGFHIVIIGVEHHPEVIGINGWCDNNADIIDENFDLNSLSVYEKLCFVAQTTFDKQKYTDIIKKIRKHQFKTVEIFDTICYTTIKRQKEAAQIAKICSLVLVVGSRTSSNTGKLFDICNASTRAEKIECAADLKKICILPDDTVGVVAGASTPTELIMEVKEYMSQNFSDAFDKEFIEGIEETFTGYKEGKQVSGTVISADENGIHVNIGGKKDGLIPKDEVNIDGTYNPADYASDSSIDAIITSKTDKESGCILLSKKRVDLIKEGDKIVESIRGGEVFELKADRDTKGGLLAKLGTYTVFIPSSQIKEFFVKDLKTFVGKTLRLTALEIDDAKHKIVASQRKVLETERKEREEIFWANVQPNVVVNGKVKRITNFGAFVSVDSFDCLAHIVDLSWSHIKSVEEVLTIGKSYDFLVLSVDREKGRVSLGFKQLQPHPFVTAMEKHPIGSVVNGKIVSIVPFGAFVEIEPGIEGLVHVSEASHNFVKNINEVVKVGDTVDVMILNIDDANRKVTLSMKACLPEEAKQESTEYSDSPKKSFKKNSPKVEEESRAEWNEDTSNNPFADLLKDIDVDKK